MSEFKKVGGTAVSNRGFSLAVAGIFGLDYREGDRYLKLDCEPAASGQPADMFVYGPQRTLRWQPPHEAEVIDDARKAEILANVIRALKFLGIKGELF